MLRLDVELLRQLIDAPYNPISLVASQTEMDLARATIASTEARAHLDWLQTNRRLLFYSLRETTNGDGAFGSHSASSPPTSTPLRRGLASRTR